MKESHANEVVEEGGGKMAVELHVQGDLAAKDAAAASGLIFSSTDSASDSDGEWDESVLQPLG